MFQIKFYMSLILMGVHRKDNKKLILIKKVFFKWNITFFDKTQNHTSIQNREQRICVNSKVCCFQFHLCNIVHHPKLIMYFYGLFERTYHGEMNKLWKIKFFLTITSNKSVVIFFILDSFWKRFRDTFQFYYVFTSTSRRMNFAF